MAHSHVAGRQKRALTRYTLFVVWELLKCRYRGSHKQSIFAPTLRSFAPFFLIKLITHAHRGCAPSRKLVLKLAAADEFPYYRLTRNVCRRNLIEIRQEVEQP